MTGVRQFLLTRVTWRRVASAVLLVLSAAFLAYKARESWEALRGYNWDLQAIYFLPSLGLFIVQWGVLTWAWKIILDRLAAPLPFADHLRIYGYTNLMRRIPAGLLWLVAGRVHAYKDHNLPARVLALGSFFEMLLAILTGLPLAALAAAGLGLLPPQVGLALAALALLLVLVAIHPAALGRLASLVKHHELRTSLRYRDTLLWAAAYTFIWLISGTGLYLVARLFGNLPAGVWPQMVGVWVLSTLFAYLTLFSPSGLGVKEVSLTVLLGLFLQDPLPLLIALGIRLIWTAYDVAVGAVAWLL
jgi:glycosyltransferase 2 family protein